MDHADAAPVTGGMTGYSGPQRFRTGDQAFHDMNIRDNAAGRIAARRASAGGTDPGSAGCGRESKT